MVVEIKHESNLSELCTVSNGDLAGLAMPGPIAVTTSTPSFTWLKTTFAIQPLIPGSEDEKLGTACVGSSICHRQDARTCVLQEEVLIIKFLPIGGLATCAIVTQEVTILAHKSQKNSVKAETFITTSFLLPSAQSKNVSCCLGPQTASRRCSPKTRQQQ